jgi:hypothetical protein
MFARSVWIWTQKCDSPEVSSARMPLCVPARSAARAKIIGPASANIRPELKRLSILSSIGTMDRDICPVLDWIRLIFLTLVELLGVLRQGSNVVRRLGSGQLGRVGRSDGGAYLSTGP